MILQCRQRSTNENKLESTQNSYLRDKDNQLVTTKMVHAGIFITDMPTTEDGELLTDEIGWDSVPNGYSGDRYIGRESNGYNLEEIQNSGKSELLLKIKVVSDTLHSTPSTIKLKSGYFGHLQCPEKEKSVLIPGIDQRNIESKFIFCLTSEIGGEYQDRPIYYTKLSLTENPKSSLITDKVSFEIGFTLKTTSDKPDKNKIDFTAIRSISKLQPLIEIEGIPRIGLTQPQSPPASTNDKIPGQNIIKADIKTSHTFKISSVNLVGYSPGLFIGFDTRGQGTCTMTFDLAELKNSEYNLEIHTNKTPFSKTDDKTSESHKLLMKKAIINHVSFSSGCQASFTCFKNCENSTTDNSTNKKFSFELNDMAYLPTTINITEMDHPQFMYYYRDLRNFTAHTYPADALSDWQSTIGKHTVTTSSDFSFYFQSKIFITDSGDGVLHGILHVSLAKKRLSNDQVYFSPIAVWEF